MEKDYTALHLEQAYGLQSLQRGAKLDFPQGVEAERLEKGLVFRKKRVCVLPKKAEPQGVCRYFDGGGYTVRLEKTCPISGAYLRLDGDKLPSSAVFRFRKEGDSIQRFGGGRKTLKKFFNEKKLDKHAREYLPLIAEKDSCEVYAVCGVEISEKVKITDETTNILYIITEKK